MNNIELDIKVLKKDVKEINEKINKILELMNAIYTFENIESNEIIEDTTNIIKEKLVDIKEQPTDKDSYTLFFDGCAKCNPGPAGAGAVIYKNNIEIWGDSKFVGTSETNNVAEYSALIFGLRKALKLNINKIHVKGDSKLIIEQVKGHYKCKSDNLKEYYEKAKELSKKFDKISFEHVYRDFNKRADELSNEGILKENKIIIS
jgi:ribonuclease HI